MYPTPPNESMWFPVGSRGEIEVVPEGIKWVPGWFARRSQSVIEMRWPEILRVRILPAKFGITTYLFEIRTVQGSRWFSTEQLDEPVLKQAIGEHVEVEEADYP
jgi:hypothetical protein